MTRSHNLHACLKTDQHISSMNMEHMICFMNLCNSGTFVPFHKSTVENPLIIVE